MPSIHSKSKELTLIKAIRARRIAMKMSLRELGKVIGRNMWAISEWESGKNRPNAESRKRLVAWLGYDPEATNK